MKPAALGAGGGLPLSVGVSAARMRAADLVEDVLEALRLDDEVERPRLR
jgi:hypothetical protein